MVHLFRRLSAAARGTLGFAGCLPFLLFLAFRFHKAHVRRSRKLARYTELSSTVLPANPLLTPWCSLATTDLRPSPMIRAALNFHSHDPNQI
jgi:hypothetical protein